MRLVRRFHDQLQQSRLCLPVGCRRTGDQPFDDLVGVAVTTLVSQHSKPFFIVEFLGGQVRPATVQSHWRVACVAEHPAADAVPAWRLLAPVVAVPGKNPQHGKGFPTRHHVARKQHHLVLRQDLSRITGLIGPEQYRHAEQTRRFQHFHLAVQALEELRPHLDTAVADKREVAIGIAILGPPAIA